MAKATKNQAKKSKIMKNKITKNKAAKNKVQKQSATKTAKKSLLKSVKLAKTAIKSANKANNKLQNKKSDLKKSPKISKLNSVKKSAVKLSSSKSAYKLSIVAKNKSSSKSKATKAVVSTATANNNSSNNNSKNKNSFTNRSGAVRSVSAGKSVQTRTESKHQPVKHQPVKLQTVKEQKALYKVGNYVVYPTHGVGKILAEETQTIGENEIRMLVIHFDRDKMTLRVPMHRASAAGLRPISGSDKIKEMYATLKSKAKISRGMWSRRAQEYEAKINSGNIILIAEVVRDLHQNVDQSERSYSERMIYENALNRVVGEVAAAEGTDTKAAYDKLMKLLRAKVAADNLNKEAA